MELIEYDKRFEHEVKNYNLSEEQLRFTSTPLECVGLSETDADRHSILGISNDEVVTFFVLHKNEGVKTYSKNSTAILLRAFSTDFNHQGKGYAKKALMLLPEFVATQFPKTTEIVLAVNVKNIAAQSLYRKCGYLDEGVRKMGRKGELMIMNYYL